MEDKKKLYVGEIVYIFQKDKDGIKKGEVVEIVEEFDDTAVYHVLNEDGEMIKIGYPKTNEKIFLLNKEELKTFLELKKEMHLSEIDSLNRALEDYTKTVNERIDELNQQIDDLDEQINQVDNTWTI